MRRDPRQPGRCNETGQSADALSIVRSRAAPEAAADCVSAGGSGSQSLVCRAVSWSVLNIVRTKVFIGPRKPQRNLVSRLQDMEKGCARAHVQMHPTSDLCKSNSQLVYKHTPNLNAIGPTVMELSMVWCLRHPLTRHVSRAVAGTGGYRIRNTLNGDIKQRRMLVNPSTYSRDVSFSKASRGQVGLD